MNGRRDALCGLDISVIERDLAVTAVTLGVGSAADSPVRFIYETPNSGAVAALPWALIPAVLVPMYLITHLAVFAQLTRATAAVGRKDERVAVERHAI